MYHSKVWPHNADTGMDKQSRKHEHAMNFVP